MHTLAADGEASQTGKCLVLTSRTPVGTLRLGHLASADAARLGLPSRTLHGTGLFLSKSKTLKFFSFLRSMIVQRVT